MAPPIYSPRELMQSKVVAVPKSTTITGGCGPVGSLKRLVGGDAVDDTVGPDFGWIVCEDGQAGARAGLDEERLDAAIDLGGAAHGGVERRDDRGDDDASDLGDVERAQSEEVAEENAQLVDGGIAVGGDTPIGEQGSGSLWRGKTIETEDRVGVANVDGEEHKEVVSCRLLVAS